MRRTVAAEMEEKSHQRSPCRLSGEPCRGKHPARAACALGRCRTEQKVVVGRLEQSESGSARHQSECQTEVSGVFRHECQTHASATHQQQSGSAEYSRMYLADERTGYRSHEHYDQRP